MFEVTGRGLNAEPEQIGATGVNEGTTGAITEIPFVVGVAHCPAPGVNV